MLAICANGRPIERTRRQSFHSFGSAVFAVLVDGSIVNCSFVTRCEARLSLRSCSSSSCGEPKLNYANRIGFLSWLTPRFLKLVGSDRKMDKIERWNMEWRKKSPSTSRRSCCLSS